ncbi:MAG: hypothetical protein IKY27_00445 [Bacteroidales bacterium]|nr:hypothetical protein [Bacteroidales bacterium]MBR5780437.1 hypothetical protein [Bacteroidales bacterium]
MALVTINGELYHYGVKGMKWGRRKARKFEAKSQNYRRKSNIEADLGNTKKANKYASKSSAYDLKSKMASAKAEVKVTKKEFQKDDKIARAEANRVANAAGSRREEKFAARYETAKNNRQASAAKYEQAKTAYKALKDERLDNLKSKGANVVNKGKTITTNITNKTTESVSELKKKYNKK